MSYLQVKNLSFNYAKAKKPLIDNFSMEMNSGEIVAIIGNSGSGKSTILRLLAGLEEAKAGIITLNNQTLLNTTNNKKIDLLPEKRGIGMIFQDYALFPHLTVLGNVMFAIKGSYQKRKNEAMTLLIMVQMQEYANKYPHQTSGGQQQRVAIARALSINPKLLLLDEPFSNLDSKLRGQVRNEIRSIIKQSQTSAILVTHDEEDVNECADRAITIGT
jgi:iron(III) transport system ATP-binding protein